MSSMTIEEIRTTLTTIRQRAAARVAQAQTTVALPSTIRPGTADEDIHALTLIVQELVGALEDFDRKRRAAFDLARLSALPSGSLP